MGIGITQEHRELADAVRGWAARAMPPEETRKLLDSTAPPGRPAYWDQAVAQGLTGIIAQLQVVAATEDRDLARAHVDRAANLARQEVR